MIAVQQRPALPAIARANLPYGVVMATGGASQLAHVCGLPTASDLLLGLAIIQAFWVLLIGMRHHRHQLIQLSAVRLAVNPPEQHAGALTVPLGLAVIEAGLATRFGAYTLSLITAAGLIFIWLTAALYISRFVIALCITPWRLYAVDGAWFLAPAVLFGIAIATAAALPPTGGGQRWLMASLAGMTTIAAMAGYWAVLLVSCLRLIQYRLAGTARAPWWIAMGCAGLAAAALARVMQIHAVPWLAVLHNPLQASMVIMYAAA